MIEPDGSHLTILKGAKTAKKYSLTNMTNTNNSNTKIVGLYNYAV